MAENGIGDFFITDAEEVAEMGGVRVPPVITPSVPSREDPLSPVGAPAKPDAPAYPFDDMPARVAEREPQPESGPVPGPSVPAEVSAPAQVAALRDPVSAPAVPQIASEPVALRPDAPVEAVSPIAPAQLTREQRLVQALDGLMDASDDIGAAALVSLDGFIMAAALPEGMHEDKVGAMSAAILGLGERAAIELGRGDLTQVFIEGEGGYVVLMAVGDRAVLTILAGEQAKLGLVLYDMRTAAETIARLLG